MSDLPRNRIRRQISPSLLVQVLPSAAAARRCALLLTAQSAVQRGAFNEMGAKSVRAEKSGGRVVSASARAHASAPCQGAGNSGAALSRHQMCA